MFEDAHEENKVNAKALDMYALGVIMWQLWFKEVPYTNKGIHQLITYVMKGNRPPLTEHDKGFKRTHPAPPVSLEKLIKDCWAQNPSSRPQIATVLKTFKSNVKRGVEEMKSDIGAVDVKTPRKTLSNAGAADMESSASTPTTSLSPTQKVAIGDFLKSCGLEKYLSKLKEEGFTDLGSICDPDLLDDDTLIKVIGMSKNDLKVFRSRIATDSAGLLTANRVKSFKERKSEASSLKKGSSPSFNIDNLDKLDKLDKKTTDSSYGTTI
jgi:hypothetical protein